MKKAFELRASYLNKKRGKNAILKGIDFVQSVCSIKDKDILPKLDGIPLFGQDSDYTRVNNILVIVYIAHNRHACTQLLLCTLHITSELNHFS